MAGLDAVVQRPQADGGLACGVDDSDNDNVYLGRTASEQECDLMIEALRRELHGIKNQLAWLTYYLDGSSSDSEREGDRAAAGGEDDGGESPELPRLQSSKLSGTRSGADTPHTAAKKVEKAREELEKAARAAMAEKQRKKYYMGVVDKAEEQQKVFHDKYLQLMQLHVEQQRQRVQENSERLHRKLRNRERREKALRLQKKPVHFRSHLSDTDTAFLSKLYRSTFYQIVGVEHQMKKAGKLTTLTDLKEFWDLMLGPALSPHDVQPVATPTQRESRSFNEEEEEGGQYVSWALTSLPPEQNVAASDGESVCTRNRVEPLKLPPVRPIVDILNSGSPTTAQHKEKRRAHRSRIQAMEGSRQHTRHMYLQARANEMAMRRLLPDINSLGLDNTDYSGLQTFDLPRKNIDSTCTMQGIAGSSARAASDDSPARAKPLIAKKQTNTGRHVSPQQTTSSKPPEQPHAPKSSNIGKEVPPPLTMDALMKGQNVKESKGKSVLWSNYTMS